MSAFQMKRLLEAMSSSNPLGDPINAPRQLNENVEDDQAEFNDEIGMLLRALKNSGQMDVYNNILKQVREVAQQWKAAYDELDDAPDKSGWEPGDSDRDGDGTGDHDDDDDDNDPWARLESWADEMRDWVRSIPQIAAEHHLDMTQFGDDDMSHWPEIDAMYEPNPEDIIQ